MFSFTFLKNLPWTFALRVLALVIILTLTCINIISMPTLIQWQKHGSIQDIFLGAVTPGGEGSIQFTSAEAIKMGVSMGDTVLNPEVNTNGDIGTPVTFLIKSKSGDGPVREVTFIRKPYDLSKYILPTFVESSPIAGLRLEAMLLWISVIFTGLFSIVAFFVGLDALMAFLVVVALSHSFALLLGPRWVFLNQILPSTAIFLLILFPNGKLAPRWSWLFILPMPNTVFTILIKTGILKWTQFTNSANNFIVEFSPIFVLMIFWVIAYWHRDSLTLNERRRINWIIFGLILIFAPAQLWRTLSMGYRREVDYLLDIHDLIRYDSGVYRAWDYLHPAPILLIVFGHAVYRYLRTFTPTERQQMKWLIFGSILGVVPFIISYIFLVYYHVSYKIFYSVANQIYLLPSYHTGQDLTLKIIGKLLYFELAVIAFSAILAMLRVRLYDVDTFINRALVYSGLIVMAGVICLLTTAFIDHTLGKITVSQKAFLLIPISIFLIVVTFKSVHFWLQNLVDKYCRPEGFDFAETFFEFTPEMRTYFTLPELSKILVTKSVEQLGVDYASVFIKNRAGKLQLIKIVSTRKKTPKPVIESQALSELKKGELVVPDLASPYSIMIPLVLPRNRKPDFIGALMLGTRLNGLGYSTEMKKSLKELGEEVGKTLYVAQVKKRG